MRRLILRPEAETDLDQIYHYIASSSGDLDRAIGYIRRIRKCLETLRLFPESGRLRNDLRPDVRIFGFKRRVVVAYMVLPSGDVEVGRFFYGGQDYETLLGGMPPRE